MKTLTAIGIILTVATAADAQQQAQPLAIGQTFTINSAATGETRTINVYSPVGLSADAPPLPVLYMPDGGMAEDFLHVAGLVQVLTGNGGMRPVLLVGIENTERRRDMTGPTENDEDRKIAPRVGGSAAFRRFIRDELMPEIARRYRTTDETAIVGESLAGLFVVETCLTEPRLFNTCIAIDPSLWWNDAALVQDGPKRAAAAGGPRLWMAVSAEPAIAKDAKTFVERARAAGAGTRLTLTEFPDEQHATIYHPAALRAFRELFTPAR
jgi:predicted alpha/beta superfamily hydrolase